MSLQFLQDTMDYTFQFGLFRFLVIQERVLYFAFLCLYSLEFTLNGLLKILKDYFLKKK